MTYESFILVGYGKNAIAQNKEGVDTAVMCAPQIVSSKKVNKNVLIFTDSHVITSVTCKVLQIQKY